MNRASAPTPLYQFVDRLVADYLRDLNGSNPGKLYRKVLNEVEPAMIRAVLAHTHGNQSRAAEILGLTRTTLRQRVRQYRLP